MTRCDEPAVYSQGGEQRALLAHFERHGVGRGCLLDVGANDGRSYSNSLALIERGWGGLLVEPHPGAADACRRRHAANPRVRVCSAGATAGDDPALATLHVCEGGTATPGDAPLVHTTVASERDRWGSARWSAVEVALWPISYLLRLASCHAEGVDTPGRVACVTIDAEGVSGALARRLARQLSEEDALQPVAAIVIEKDGSASREDLELLFWRFGFVVALETPENVVLTRGASHG